MTKHNLSLEEYTIEAKKRFMSHVFIPENLSDCWEWVGAKHYKGYGQFKYKNRICKSHRVSFELFVGLIPEDLCVCHTCDNRACVNPAHLWLGTNQDNMDDRDRKGRNKFYRGEEHANHQLTKQKVLEIREMLQNSDLSQRKIATLFHISQSTITNINTKKAWGWL